MSNPIYVPGEGPAQADYIVVGEAPGYNEEKQLRPFVGSSGKLLRYCMDRVGIDEEHTYISNVCHYRPPNNSISKFCPKRKKGGVPYRSPNELVRHGLYELYSDIARIRPKVVIPVGNVALWALTGYEEITKRRGSVYPVSFDTQRMEHVLPFFSDADGITDTIKTCMDVKVVPTIHPAAVDRQYFLKPIFEKDLKKAKRESAYPDVRWPERDITVDPDQDRAYRLVDRLADYPTFAFDIETPGGELYCVGFSADPSWGFVLRTDAQWKIELIRMLLDSEREKIAHNGLFDTGYLLYHYGIDVKNYTFDTMYTIKLLYPEFRQGLDFCTSFLTDEPFYKDEGKDQDLSIADDAYTYMLYCGKDACLTMESALQMQQHEMRKPVHLDSVTRHMQLLPIARNIMVRGILVDQKVRERIRDETLEKLAKAQVLVDDAVLKDCIRIAERSKDSTTKLLAVDLAKRVQKAIEETGYGFNVYSTPDMQAYLYTIKGMKVKRHKNTKRPTTEEVALKELYGETGDESLLQIVKCRQARKLLSNYLAPHAIPNGRLMYSVNIVGTDSARWSSGQTIIITKRRSKKKKKREPTGANAQTIPPPVREMCVADPGYILFNADLRQVEDRIVAYVGNVAKKMHGFENGIDGHALTASGFFNASVEEILAEDKECKRLGKTPPMRYIGKQSNHAFNYGEGWMTFMKNLNKKADETGVRVNARQAKSIRLNHFTMYPEVEDEYWPWIKSQLQRKGRLQNPFGYERTFYGLRNWPKRDESVYRQGFAWYPQSTAPEIINRSMVRMHKELPEVEILLHTHDGIIGQLPERLVEEYRDPILQLMDEPLYIRDKEIHIPVDLNFGENWRAVS